MSYILDALKKSEEKRGVLSLSEYVAPASTQKTSATRRFGLPLLIALTMLASGWMIAQLQQTPDNIAEKTSLHVAAQSEQRRANESVTLFEPSGRVEPINQIKQTEQIKQTATSLFRPVTPASPISRASPSLEISSPTKDQASEESPQNGLTFNALPSLMQQSLGDIKIEGHIYDDKPSVRMVIINGRVYREKQLIRNDLLLQNITPDGATFMHQKHVFHMGVFDQ